MTSQTESLSFPFETRHRRVVAAWLLICAFSIFMMALVGAVTRLTESGLSITEWRPVVGAVLPSGEQAWQHEFDLYQKTPEYRQKNMGMSLKEFKGIYFWEWFHRNGGRAIGVLFLVPFVVFWFWGWLSPRLTWGLFALLLFGGLQGAVGWIMVQSGLIDRPSVSHYRLALHLSFALGLYTALLWAGRLVVARAHFELVTRPSKGLLTHGVVSIVLLGLTIVWGAFVAGLDAGLIYNEFPTMGAGRLVPAEMWHHTPWWLNFFENHASVQFTHRVLAMIAVLLILSFAAHAMLANQALWVYPAMAVMVLLQAGLGILTLLSEVNIFAAVAHQGGAMILLGLLVVGLQDLIDRFRER